MTHPDGVARFRAHGGDGRLRADGSRFSALCDAEAFAAEEWGCRLFGKEPDRTLLLTDPGYDCLVSIDFKHLGLYPDGEPRRWGHLIVNPGKVIADRFYCISGTSLQGFRCEGFATRRDVLERPLHDFGFGPKHYVPLEALRRHLGGER